MDVKGTTEKQPRILVVDDEDHFRNRLVKAFIRRGFDAKDAACYEEAVAALRANSFDMAVFDLKMPGRSGLELLKEARSMQPDLKILVLTGYGSIATATDAIRLGAIYYLPKPADVDDILAAFSRNPEEQPTEVPTDIPTPSLARAEWEHINRVLADCGGNISAAAKRLNVHRRTLQRKLIKYPPRE
jgi:two-component system response regulator RegA